jgi:hypothetical protein
MALLRSHDDKVLWSLTKAIRLLLPADPSFDRMLDACRQYQPTAWRHGSGGCGRRIRRR